MSLPCYSRRHWQHAASNDAWDRLALPASLAGAAADPDDRSRLKSPPHRASRANALRRDGATRGGGSLWLPRSAQAQGPGRAALDGQTPWWGSVAARFRSIDRNRRDVHCSDAAHARRAPTRTRGCFRRSVRARGSHRRFAPGMLAQPLTAGSQGYRVDLLTNNASELAWTGVGFPGEGIPVGRDRIGFDRLRLNRPAGRRLRRCRTKVRSVPLHLARALRLRALAGPSARLLQGLASPPGRSGLSATFQSPAEYCDSMR